MVVRSWFPALFLLLSVFAGCLSGPGDLALGDARDAPSRVPFLLDGVIEPAGFDVPTFDLLGAIAKTGPVYGGGEPSIWADLDGTLWLAFPGCDTALYLVPDPSGTSCDNGPVYRGDDAGASWTRLNDPDNGKLDPEGPRANGDAEVAVDTAGNVYVSNLGGGIPVVMSTDRGESWRFIGNVVEVEQDAWADRQWMAAGDDGHLIVTWMGGANGTARQVAVNTTFDHGGNWTGTTYLGDRIGWIGPVEIDTDGKTAYIAFTDRDPDGFHLRVAKTIDGGLNWSIQNTSVRPTTVDTWPVGVTDQWSGVLMAPALDILADGTVVYVWSEEVPGAMGLAQTGAVVKYIASTDEGLTWLDPVVVSERASAIMPWATGGADRLAINYYASDVGLESDYAGVWDVMAAFVDDVASATPVIQHAVVEASVHQGGLCARGGACLITGSDRALLDFFESTVLPDGRFAVAYAADPVEGGKYIDIRVAVQDGGSPLFVRPGAAGLDGV